MITKMQTAYSTYQQNPSYSSLSQVNNQDKHSQQQHYNTTGNQQLTIETLNRRLQKIQYTYDVTQKYLKQQKKNNDQNKLHILKLENKVQDLQRQIKNQDQQNFRNKKQISQLRDKNQQLIRNYSDMKEKIQRMFKGYLNSNSTNGNSGNNNVNLVGSSKINTGGNNSPIPSKNDLFSNISNIAQNIMTMPGVQNQLKKSNFSEKSNKAIKTKFRMDMPNQLKQQITKQEIKINSAMSMVTQWARYNYRTNYLHGTKSVEKVSQGEGNQYIQLCGMEEFSKYGTSYFMIKLLKTQKGNIRVGVTCQAAKTSKVDQKYSISYKLGTGQVLIDKKWRKLGKKIQEGQTITVTVDRQAGTVTFSQDQQVITRVQMTNQMFDSKLYPKIEMCNLGDCVELM